MAVTAEQIVETFEKMDEENQSSLVVSLVAKMKVMGVVETVKKMEDKFGVSAAAAVTVAAPAGGGAAAAVQEKTEFTVVMKDFGANKVGVIKVVRAVTGLGLKEAKDLVEAIPAKIKEKVAKAEAEDIVKQLTEAGAKADIE